MRGARHFDKRNVRTLPLEKWSGMPAGGRKSARLALTRRRSMIEPRPASDCGTASVSGRFCERMGLEPRPSAWQVKAAFAPVRARSLKAHGCRSFADASDRKRTRTNDERDHCDHVGARAGHRATATRPRHRRRVRMDKYVRLETRVGQPFFLLEGAVARRFGLPDRSRTASRRQREYGERGSRGS